MANGLPEWDYHPTGLLSFEFEHRYLWGEAPRRSSATRKSSGSKTWQAILPSGSQCMPQPS